MINVQCWLLANTLLRNVVGILVFCVPRIVYSGVTDDCVYNSASESPHSSDCYSSVSPLLSVNTTPLVMLALSNDHQLHYKSFTDYDDLNGDNIPDTTYNNDISYVGYFDNKKCYIYDLTNKHYSPSALMDNAVTPEEEKYCNLALGTNNQWSGNFLNWATMTRIDQVRKVLYGGFRSDDPTDKDSKTILERSHLPTDAHSFAKYYNGADLKWLTPFGPSFTATHSTPTNLSDVKDTGITMCNTTIDSGGSSSSSSSGGASCSDQCNYNGTNYPICSNQTSNGYQFWENNVAGSCIYFDSCKDGSWGAFSWTASVVPGSCPATTEGNNFTTYEHPPLMRVVKGNYSLWAANERWQCLYNGTGGNAVEGKNTGVDDSIEGKNANVPEKTGIYAYNDSPNTSEKATQRNGVTIGDYVAKVEVCKSEDLIGGEACKRYPNGNLKPVGILQQFGDSGDIEFGLITGSYKKNKSGGVLRKNISNLFGEINVGSNGVFTGADGIIKTVNLLRIANYNYSDGTYNATDNCSWNTSSFSDGSCTNWGNPFSEILYECYRYFAGKSATTAYDGDDSSIIPGLNRVVPGAWNDPITAENYCAKLNVIAFNASSSSYDHSSSGLSLMDLNSGSRPDGKTTAKLITDWLGVNEGLPGLSYFIGENGTDNNQVCTAKEITNFGDVRGTCPDSPRLSGSYQMAGISYHAHTHDIRTDRSESQTVDTYGVTLAPGVPNVVIPVPSSDEVVRILPACRANVSGGTGNCGLVDFKIVKHNEPTETDGEFHGSFYVNWEDTEQGGDYDMDMYGIIKYWITSTKVTVKTEIIEDTTPTPMGFGFVISGTTNDGFNVWTGVNGFNSFVGCPNSCGSAAKKKEFTIGTSSAKLLEQPLFYAAKWGGFTDSDSNMTPSIASNLSDAAEWDSKNNTTGAFGADGVPDNYFEATNPDQLQSQLSKILTAILDRTASGTSAAVVTNAGSGEGALYQALFNPRYSANLNPDGTVNYEESVRWVGTLNALFLDKHGNLREDNTTPGQLTNDDYVIDIEYNSAEEKTLFTRHYYVPDVEAEDSIGSVVAGESFVDLKFLKAIWSAGEELAKIGAGNYSSQRANYSDSATTGRYILTGIDLNDDGQIGSGESGEVVDFVASSFSGALSTNSDAELYRLLGLDSTTVNSEDPSCTVDCEATNLINYIRGEPIDGYRSRRANVDGSGDRAFLLGDIGYSSPHPVQRPAEGYDLNFADPTYRTFRETYRNRREVVYIGANDGMLHAFNAGFFDSGTSTYKLKPDEVAAPVTIVTVDDPDKRVTETSTVTTVVTSAGTTTITDVVRVTELLDGGDVVATETVKVTPSSSVTDASTLSGAHPLGSELWAYVPYNLLPHLRWLTEEEYPHVYYVDGSIKHYDVNIFTPDATHPGGWGTILVVGMRFGGGEYSLNPEDDYFDLSANPSDEITLRSAYLVLDITDPEQPPSVIGEITAPELGYTLAEPALVKRRIANSSGSYAPGDIAYNNWSLVFGSGPLGADATGKRKALDEAVSEGTPKLYIYDLISRSLSSPIDTGGSNGFVGGVSSMDWNVDYIDDVVYFGTVAGSASSPSGKLQRYVLDYSGGFLSVQSSDVSDVIDPGKPFSATPMPVRSLDGDYWIYSGTGRYFSSSDNFSGFDPSDAPQSFYAVKEPKSSGALTEGTVVLSDMVNTTGLKVYTDGSIYKPMAADSKLSSTTTFDGVGAVVQGAGGWFFDFTRQAARNYTNPAVAGQSVIFAEYEPSGLRCEPLGEGFLNAVHMKVGLPGTFSPLGSVPLDTDTDGDGIPDSIDPDIDGDGIPNELDPDIDGDGVLNESDGSPAGAYSGDGAKEEVSQSTSTGEGGLAAPVVYQNPQGENVAALRTTTADSDLQVVGDEDVSSSRQSWREIILD